jgi:hypothetical protein
MNVLKVSQFLITQRIGKEITSPITFITFIIQVYIPKSTVKIIDLLMRTAQSINITCPSKGTSDNDSVSTKGTLNKNKR